MGSRKLIIDKFQEHLHAGFEAYCSRHGLEPSEGQLLTYLIDEDLIASVALQRYAVRKEFEQIRSTVKCTKSLAVDTLAHRFHLSERTIWAIIRDVSSKRHPTQTSKHDTLNQP
jgi:hypothetical protein